MDWNQYAAIICPSSHVSPFAGRVDWNTSKQFQAVFPQRLSLCGESGLKSLRWQEVHPVSCLSLCGESGLKLYSHTTMLLPSGSLPLRGEWIEILTASTPGRCGMSLPLRGEWIEIGKEGRGLLYEWSLPLRGEWIEIWKSMVRWVILPVSPFAGRVDWNSPSLFCPDSPLVSPFAGRVDWNLKDCVFVPNPPCLSLCGESGLK